MADLSDLNIGPEPENTRQQVHDNNYTLNQIRNLLYADPENLENHPHARQPDGDLVGDKATGEVFRDSVSLAADGTYTSDWYDTDGWSSVEFFVTSTSTSTEDGVKIQYTADANAETPTVEAEFPRTYDAIDIAQGFRIYRLPTELDGVRFVFNNNGDPTDLTVIGTFREEVSLDGAHYVRQNNLGQNEVAVGNDPNSQGLSIGNPSSLFGDLATIERTGLIDISSSFGTSTVTDEISTVGSGSITQDPDPATGEIVIDPGATADSSIELRTAEFGRYTPGYSAQQGCGIRMPNPPTDAESEARWGYFDAEDGFYWGFDGGQQELFIARRVDGTETERVYRSNWNRNNIDDVLDREIGVQDGNIFQIDFSWYGYGIIIFSIVSQTNDTLRPDDPTQKSTTVHAITVTDRTSITDPNQPITVEAENGTAGESYEVRVGGRQFSIFGNQPTGNRNTAETRFGAPVNQDTWTHMMSWRRKTVSGAEPNARLNTDSLDIATTQTSKYALVINPILNDPVWRTPNLTDPDETLLEVTTDGTFGGLDGGTKIWETSTRVSGTGQAQTNSTPDVDLNLGQNNIVSLLAWGDGGSGTATTTIRMSEDW